MIGVILAAGKGTRLAPYTKAIPKPLMPLIKDKWGNRKLLSIIEFQILQLKLANVTNIVIVVNYKKKMIQEYLSDGKNYGVKIQFVTQKKNNNQLRGNGDAFFTAKENYFSKDIEKAIILDADNYFSDPLTIKKALDSHSQNQWDVLVGVNKVKDYKKFAIFQFATTVKTKNEKFSNLSEPINIIEKPQQKIGKTNWAKSGLMILNQKCLSFDREIAMISNTSKKIKEKYTTTAMIQFFIKNQNIKVGLFPFEKPFNDLGTWNEYLSILKRNL